MIISLNTALDLKIFSPSEPIGIFIIFVGLIFTSMIFYIIHSTSKKYILRWISQDFKLCFPFLTFFAWYENNLAAQLTICSPRKKNFVVIVKFLENVWFKRTKTNVFRSYWFNN